MLKVRLTAALAGMETVWDETFLMSSEQLSETS
jgi:hypothetical protein